MTALGESVESPQRPADPARSSPGRRLGDRVDRLSLLGRAAAISLREAALVGAGLAALCFAVFGARVADGGYLSDDWSWAATYDRLSAQHGFLGALTRMNGATEFIERPLFGGAFGVQQAVLGDSMRLHLAWLLVLWILAATLFYVLLRTLGLARLHAGAMAFLAVLLPASDSSRLWYANSVGDLSICLYFTGTLIALLAFRRRGREALLWHALSLGLFVLDIALYEATAGVIFLSVLLYRLRVPWKPALIRWAFDVAAVGTLVGWHLHSYKRGDAQQSFQHVHDMLVHLKVVARQGLALIERLGQADVATRLPWFVCLAIVVASLVVWYSRRRRSEGARQLGYWLAALGGGLLGLAASYAVFVPASQYYVPLGVGTPNHINLFPTFPLVIVIYALLMLVGQLVGLALPSRKLLAPAVAIVLTLVLGAVWARADVRHVNAYNAAFAQSEQILHELKTAVGTPPHGTTIYLFGHTPERYASNVRVFYATWDFEGAVQLLWHDFTLHGIPYTAINGDFNADPSGQRGVTCGPDSLQPHNALYGPKNASSYGKAVFFDVRTRTATWITSRRTCRAAATKYIAPIVRS